VASLIVFISKNDENFPKNHKIFMGFFFSFPEKKKKNLQVEIYFWNFF
jgi:hexokinase